MPSDIKDKNSEPINEGDHVWTKIRGGRHEGDVQKIVTTEAEAKKEGVKHPPKVSEGRARDESIAGAVMLNCFSVTGSLHGSARA